MPPDPQDKHSIARTETSPALGTTGSEPLFLFSHTNLDLAASETGKAMQKYNEKAYA